MAWPSVGVVSLIAGAPVAGLSRSAATAEVGAESTVSGLPRRSLKVARTRRLWPTCRSPGWKVAPLPTSDHTPGPVSACQTNWMVPVLMPLRSLNACVAVSS